MAESLARPASSLILVLERIAAQTEADKQISTGIAFSFAPGITIEGFVFDLVRR
ncbi:hypothetical protein [Nocardia gamkensis]|uniref:Uncharacterized protein n=1 Tax=Nocardia gamkensis TaxID=352869 RepID=A0A7X6L1N3_9NOCA|nr:hypothetical protein [Nocardia gamkensis]NKY26042.1 hypothetical protein [Nocardia gamkensis]NQE72168.1 Alpha-pyrone synthesis polyketide synthase-like Pks18 [Nocardia gamkensis]